jgi:DNA-binding protein VF530
VDTLRQQGESVRNASGGAQAWPGEPFARIRSVYTSRNNFNGFAAAMSVQDLHGITLEALLTRLVAHYGWDGLAKRIDINCFISEPSIKSSLKFLRKTPWARKKVEDLYLETRLTN